MRVGNALPADEVRGFTLLIMLGLIATLSLAMGVAGATWKNQAQREREAEWLRVGETYAQAIENYWVNSPGSVKQRPISLKELLMDVRFVGTHRYLRQLYADPLRPTQDWALLRDEQARIVGVYSNAPGEPFLIRPPVGSHLKQRSQGEGYARWAFVAGTAYAKSSESTK